MNIELWQRINTLVEQGNIERAIETLEVGLASGKSEKFKSLMGAEFTNNETEIAGNINRFIASCEKSFEVKSVYLEMNGFDINQDRWYFDFFAYDIYEKDEEDLDWLSEWKSEEWPDTRLVGLEAVQGDFDWLSNKSGYKDPLAKEASEYAVLLVMCKFANLIRKSVATGCIEKKIPILATAHDFDIILRLMA